MHSRYILICGALLVSTSLLSAEHLREIFEPDPTIGDDYADVSLQIESMRCESWSNCTIRATGAFRGEPVGVEIKLLSRSGQERILYRSIGDRSDSLLSALSLLYKLPRTNRHFAPEASADIVFLDATKDKVSGKAFFAANGPESAYAELYTNIDKTRGTIEICEKDSEYRKNVIKGLSK